MLGKGTALPPILLDITNAASQNRKKQASANVELVMGLGG